MAKYTPVEIEDYAAALVVLLDTAKKCKALSGAFYMLQSGPLMTKLWEKY